MCVILYLPAGSMISEKMLFNAVHNNPHGYGILTKKNGELDLKKGMFIDPDILFGKLAKDKDFDRFVHLRYNTVGETSEDNLHPFLSYDGIRKVGEEGNRIVYFMHNGTLHNYKPTYVQGSPNNSKDSDSNRFNQEFLKPALSRLYTENGFADYNDPMFQKWLDKMWDYNSKGLLISNDLDPSFIRQQSWKKFSYEEAGKKVEYYASNDDYFSELKRGPLFDKRKEEQEKAKRILEDKTNIVPFQKCNLRTNLNEAILREVDKVFVSVDIWEDSGLCDLRYLTREELDEIQEKHPNEFSALFYHLLDRFSDVVAELNISKTKHEKASLVIEALKNKEKENA